MWDSVPWFVAGGRHMPEVERLLAYAATGGAEGVVQSGDAKVRQLAVPAASVRVMPGAVVVPNGAAGAASQSYLARNPEAEVVVMTATGSGGPRSDLIIARIEDPQYPGTSDPVDPEVGPYVFSRVIENVPSNTRRVQELAGHENDSAITLARVTRPASTGTVLDSHITDLRELATPRVRHEVRIANPVGSDSQDTTGVAGEVWPDEATWTITIPTWATAVRIVATWAQVYVLAGVGTAGWLWVLLGDGDVNAVPTQQVRYDTASAGGSTRESFVCADEIDIPAGLRGKTVTVNLRAQKTSGDPALVADAACATSVLFDFIEKPV